MTLGAEAWYFICENIVAARAGHSSLLFTSPPLSGQSIARAVVDFDVNMAETPISFTSSAGKKRSRDADGDADAFEYEARLEKVGERHALSLCVEIGLTWSHCRKHARLLAGAILVTHGARRKTR